MSRKIRIPARTIMTPGPVEVYPSVLRAMGTPILGQFDPMFLKVMDEVKEMIKVPFQTKNEEAFAIDGTSRSGLEAALIALIEPGDKVLIPAYGRFAYLLGEIAERAKADVIYIEKEWDSVFEPKVVIDAIKKYQPKIVAMVHGETANGQMQPLKEIGEFCRENDLFFVVDTVATYGGAEIKVDEWQIDVAIAGSQKCVSVPAGLSLITYNERVKKVLASRYQKELGLSKDIRNKRHISSNYLDLSQLERYWNQERINHHTEATSMIYALHEGLSLLLDEGIENSYQRHKLNDQAIVAGIKSMGLDLYGDMTTKMPTVTPILIPEEIDGESVRSMLLEEFGIEIASSFGPLQNKVWRIGNMGYSSRKENVLHVLGALEAVLIFHGANVSPGKAIQEALNVYLTSKQ
ncbi:alanine--glyoxylate aminotransferase family protein [Vagococcus carniphilus]|uniref:Alanine--glyoxylate aminotransferase family protein n=1 Tax=Vagococcus carniphilus TaxID=218144 RepID=A0AAW8U1H3_9ENTE|nr:alanine--glyoxylate aminotransferase family protein [Vagococcus carniphilus]MDT2829403.1 alanine--glyoxylate aminotransferase family protein [Vagococcus carniphilus]MDT2833390.1 alanine--glyoxylate aminotransferase family protein [Vagococcus carniphilus]MDT2838862.1 alanine--glyoxylate aminotransferase family protein [Vagococcus carniphilus]MDT2852920.1 alanine--glyoxylate aminotransferase family protein [Vagococcus carniphilus]